MVRLSKSSSKGIIMKYRVYAKGESGVFDIDDLELGEAEGNTPNEAIAKLNDSRLTYDKSSDCFWLKNQLVTTELLK